MGKTEGNSHGKSEDWTASGWPGDHDHFGRQSAAEITIPVFAHVWRQILPDSATLGVNDSGLLQLAGGILRALDGRRIVRIFLRLPVFRSPDGSRFL